MHDQADLRDAANPPPEALRWRCWPLCESSVRAFWALFCLSGVGLLAYWLTGQVYLALLALAALMASLWRFFLPVVFELNEKGIHQRILGRHRCIPWHAIRRYEVCAAGLLLLPDDDPSLIAYFGGIYLPWAGYRDEVLAVVAYYLNGNHL